MSDRTVDSNVCTIFNIVSRVVDNSVARLTKSRETQNVSVTKKTDVVGSDLCCIAMYHPLIILTPHALRSDLAKRLASLSSGSLECRADFAVVFIVTH